MAARRGQRTRRASTLAAALASPTSYDHEVRRIRVIETHISWVFLTGRYAYKVKKPLKLAFLDFSTLARRRHFCREEVRLNRRLAPQLYLGVVPIGGSSTRPRVGKTPAIDYAVKMRQFASEALLDRQLAKGSLTARAMTDFAERLAAFHGSLPPIRRKSLAASVSAAALRNLGELGAYWRGRHAAALATLRAWNERELANLAWTFAQRVSAGAVRECHGDLHLKNLLWHDGAIEAFDALEFDPSLREIDVLSEVAFLAMDLGAHGRTDLAYAFVNRYLEVTGDYAGVQVLTFYLVQRALVRAKVGAIARLQTGSREHGNAYLRTALALATPRRPVLAITHGFSGSGKTFVTNELIGAMPALRARSDLERKRLHGLGALAESGSAVGQGLYSRTEGARTYARLATIADTLLRGGFDAIIDASFLRRRERLEIRQVAAANAAGFAILDCTAPPAELRRRILQRRAGGRDASEADLAVLDYQLATHEPLDRAERRCAIRVATDRPLHAQRLARRLART